MQQVNMLVTVPGCLATDLTAWCLHNTTTTERIALNALQACNQAALKLHDIAICRLAVKQW